MSVHAFPVRLAETVNRFGTARLERSAVSSAGGGSALVTLGERSLLARVHGERVTRRGRQTLVSVHGRRTWIASQRVQSLDEGEGLTA